MSDEREDEPELTGSQVERLLPHGGPRLLVEDRRDQPQRVHRGEHDPERHDRRVAPALVVDAGHDQELAGERRRARHRERDHPGESARPSRAPGRPRAMPPSACELARPAAPLDHPDEQEHARRR